MMHWSQAEEDYYNRGGHATKLFDRNKKLLIQVYTCTNFVLGCLKNEEDGEIGV